MLLYNRIRELAKEKGFSVREVERHCGFANATLRRWGTIDPSVGRVARVAKFLNVTLDELVKEDA